VADLLEGVEGGGGVLFSVPFALFIARASLSVLVDNVITLSASQSYPMAGTKGMKHTHITYSRG
ncbi:hypothetical protein HAX54_021854, partial [Datura stramonium]|nr:hypothetical protein [Datura stramonium]